MTKILIADDDQLVRDTVSQSLHSKGFEIITANDGEMAVYESLKSRPDLVLLDYLMPKANGFDVCKRIKSLREDFVPVIMVTSKDGLDYKMNGMISGADDYFPKPLKIQELLVRIKAMLRIKAQHDQVQKTSIKDSQTGLFNRKHLSSRLKQEIARVKRVNLPLSCLMLDVDEFKTVNDIFGHQFGDGIMNQVASFVRTHVRTSDDVFRYGDDEFLVLMPETRLAEAKKLADTLRKEMKKERFVHDEETIQLTGSIGVCCFNGQTITDEENLIARLDQAVMEAKQSGKNRVAIHKWDKD